MKRLFTLGLSAALAACATGPVEQPENWTVEEGHRWRELAVRGGAPGFESVVESGIDFVNGLSDGGIVQNRNRMNGSGVTAGDVDGDGLPDVFFAGMETPARLYRNLGDFQFEDVTALTGLDRLLPPYTTGAVFVDVDGDLDQDLFVTALQGPNRMLINDLGRFRLGDPVLASVRGGMTAAFADTDGDGDLDLYVSNYKRMAVRDSLPPDQLLFDRITGDDGQVIPELTEHFRIDQVDGRPIRLELGEEDQYYLNLGGGRFEPAEIPGVDRDWGMTARLQDVSGDGVPDLYVANDFESPDYFLLGDGDGGWIDAAGGLAHTSNSSMAVAISDVDGNGVADLFVPDMLSPDPMRSRYEVGTAAPFMAIPGDLKTRPQYMQNTLHLGRGDGTYAEVARLFGVEATEWSWSSVFTDVDLDGWDDLLVTTGHSFDVQDADAQVREREGIRRVRSVEAFRALITEYPRLELENVALRNERGSGFSPVTEAWGLGAEADISHGLALADFDRDGDLDVVTNRLNAPAGVFRNRGDEPRVAVRLEGNAPNTTGIGARVELHAVGRVLTREMISGGQYLSGSEPLAVFAALADSMTLVVRWRSGRVSRIEGVSPNRLYVVTESQAPQEPAPPVGQPLVPSSTLIATFEPAPPQDPQIPAYRTLGADGPPVAVGDLDGDGRHDIVIGAVAGGRPEVLLASGQTIATPPADGPWTGMALADGRLSVAVSGSPAGGRGHLQEFRILGAALVPTASIPLGLEATGPVAVADVDADGDVDVFVGMGSVPGQYPRGAPSMLFLRDGDALSGPVELQAGSVTGAAFGDADGDGDPDLAVATEWGPVRLFLNQDGWADVSEDWGLGSHTGLWRGVAWGDVDQDGRADLVATNWGWNSHLGRHGAPGQPEEGLRMYVNDQNRDGMPDPVLATYRQDLSGWSPVAGFNELRTALPQLGRRVSSFHAFAGSTVEDLFGPEQSFLEARTLASTIFLNRGHRFEPEPLPQIAQRSPATQVVVQDLTGDGRPDIALGQNYFPVRPTSMVRQDAGRGLLLRQSENGWDSIDLGVFGDQRGLAVLGGDIVLTLRGGTAYRVTLGGDNRAAESDE